MYFLIAKFHACNYKISFETIEVTQKKLKII